MFFFQYWIGSGYLYRRQPTVNNSSNKTLNRIKIHVLHKHILLFFIWIIYLLLFLYIYIYFIIAIPTNHMTNWSSPLWTNWPSISLLHHNSPSTKKKYNLSTPPPSTSFIPTHPSTPSPVLTTKQKQRKKQNDMLTDEININITLWDWGKSISLFKRRVSDWEKWQQYTHKHTHKTRTIRRKETKKKSKIKNPRKTMKIAVCHIER